jgi:hypothetical protein
VLVRVAASKLQVMNLWGNSICPETEVRPEGI